MISKTISRFSSKRHFDRSFSSDSKVIFEQLTARCGTDNSHLVERMSCVSAQICNEQFMTGFTSTESEQGTWVRVRSGLSQPC